MLIEHYELELVTPACHADSERYTARAHLAVDISEVLPYLNAVLEGAAYYCAPPVLVCKKGGHGLALRPREIAVSNALDRDEARGGLEEAIALVNRTWEQRSGITPSTATRRRVGSMELFKLLPRTNCRQCGQPTCQIFALKLAAGQRRLADCPALAQPEQAASLAALQALIIDTPAAG